MDRFWWTLLYYSLFYNLFKSRIQLLVITVAISFRVTFKYLHNYSDLQDYSMGTYDFLESYYANLENNTPEKLAEKWDR